MAETVLEELLLDGFSLGDTARAAGVSLPVLRSWRSSAPISADKLERLQRLESVARRIREITGSDSGAALISPRFAGSDRNGIDVIVAGCDDLLISWAAGSVTTTEMLDRVFDDWRHDPALEVFTASDGLPGLRGPRPRQTGDSDHRSATGDSRSGANQRQHHNRHRGPAGRCRQQHRRQRRQRDDDTAGVDGGI